MNNKIQEKLNELRAVLVSELSSNTVSANISVNGYGVDFYSTARTAEELKRDGVSMKNLSGEFIK